MNIYPFIIHLPVFQILPHVNFWILNFGPISSPSEVTGYGIMMMVGFLMGGWLIGLELKRRGLYQEYAADITVAAVVGGIIGAKVWYWALNEGPLFSRGGLVWYGGFLGGALAVMLNGRRLKVPIRWTLHLTAPALAAAYAIGRIGCFIVNDDYGHPTNLPWGVKFPQGLPPSTAQQMQETFRIPVAPGTDPATVLAVHPTQLYEAFLMLGAFAILWRLRSSNRPIGWLFGVYLVFAGLERFLMEFVRAKDDRFFGPFTLAQAVSVVLVVIGTTIVATWRGDGAALEAGDYLTTKPA